MWWSTLIPAAALLIGLLIGGVVVGVAGGDSGSTTPQPTDSATEGATEDPSTAATAVVVPDECLAAVETVEEVTELVREGVAAISDFQTDALRSLLREFETLDARAREQIQACREVRTEEAPLPE